MHSAHPVSRVPSYPWHMPSGWWLKKRNYLLYMIRELTAVFAALWVVIFLAQLPLLKSSPDSWSQFMRSPGWMLFSLISLLFILYHAFTWFNLMGTVLYLRPGKQAIPGRTIVAVMLFVWAAVSIVIALVLITPALGR